MKVSYWIIGFLLVVILIQRACQKKCPEQPKPVTIIQIDSFPVHDTIDKPIPYAVQDSGYLLVYKDIDTAAILSDYYKARDYSMVIHNDSSARLILDATVYKNSLTRAVLSGDFFTKTIKETKFIPIPDNPHFKVFGGFQISGGKDYLGLAPSILLETKKEHTYAVGYDPFNKMAYGSMWWKISLRKNKN